MNTLLVAAALVAGSMSPGVLQGASADISGTWELSVTTSRGVESATLTLKKNGDTFSGTGARGTEQALLEAFGDLGDGTFTGTRKREAGPTPASK
jgi:hypothetical protein